MDGFIDCLNIHFVQVTVKMAGRWKWFRVVSKGEFLYKNTEFSGCAIKFHFDKTQEVAGSIPEKKS